MIHSKRMVSLAVIRSHSREGNGTPLLYSCLENPIDRGAWQAAVHGVAKSWTWLSDFTFTFHFHALEKEMATHSSVLAWRIPGTGEPGGLQSMGLHRVGHDWSDLAAAAAANWPHSPINNQSIIKHLNLEHQTLIIWPFSFKQNLPDLSFKFMMTANFPGSSTSK